MKTNIKANTPKSTDEKTVLITAIAKLDPKADKVVLIAKSREFLRSLKRKLEDAANNPAPATPEPVKPASKKKADALKKAASDKSTKRHPAMQAALEVAAENAAKPAAPVAPTPKPADIEGGTNILGELHESDKPLQGVTLKIFGANLRDQSKGQFVVHTVDCTDCKKLEKMREHFCIETHASALSVSNSIWESHIKGEEITAEEGLAEIYFAPCVKFPGEAPAAPAPVPAAPEPAKRYESKTPADSNYHNRERSTIKTPVAVAWDIYRRNFSLSRKELIGLAMLQGVQKNTAATQYSFWKNAEGDALRAAVATPAK